MFVMIVIITINGSNVHDDSHNNKKIVVMFIMIVIRIINSSNVHNDSHNNNK
jgi:hypothetical protein